MVGLVGSGKSAVALELGERTDAIVVNSDDIRTRLRERGVSFDYSRIIAENLAWQLIDTGRNVILDSDFIDYRKRASIREKARKLGVPVHFVRTFCDIDIVTHRVVNARYLEDGFFGGAGSPVEGSSRDIGTAVKMREMWRRTPLHYRWSGQGGGQWKLRKLPFKVVAEINTGVESERAEGMDVAAISINYLARTS